jgi:hypothetical protein
MFVISALRLVTRTDATSATRTAPIQLETRGANQISSTPGRASQQTNHEPDPTEVRMRQRMACGVEGFFFFIFFIYMFYIF